MLIALNKSVEITKNLASHLNEKLKWLHSFFAEQGTVNEKWEDKWTCVINTQAKRVAKLSKFVK